MPSYSYTAIDKTGKYLRGEIEAPDQTRAVEIIKERGSFPTGLKEANAEKRRISSSTKERKDFRNFNLPIFGRSVKTKHLISFMQQLSTLTTSGLPVMKGLNILGAQTRNPVLKKAINEMVETISAGGSFSDAMQKFPNIFPQLSVDLIKSGEASGAFDKVLSRIANFMEKSYRTRQRIANAMIYPAIVITISITVMTFLIIFAVPKFMALFAELNIALPVTTALLLKMSNFLKDRWYMVFFTIFFIIIAYKKISRQNSVRFRIDWIKLKLPIFGLLFQKMSILRFSRTLNTLISSGVPILGALSAAKDVCGNKVLSSVVEKAYEGIREGDAIAQSFSHGDVFPPLFISMVAVGEESGSLDKALAKIADIYEDDVDNQVSSLMALLEPFLIVTLALIVGFIVVSMFLPLIKLLDSLSV